MASTRLRTRFRAPLQARRVRTNKRRLFVGAPNSSRTEEALYGNERAPSTDTQVCYYNAPGPIRPDRIAIYMQ